MFNQALENNNKHNPSKAYQIGILHVKNYMTSLCVIYYLINDKNPILLFGSSTN
jgi:hypothetical protein